MRNKTFIFFVIGVLVLGVMSSYAQTKKLKQIGRYTLVRVKGEVPTSEIMQILVDKYSGDIKYGFDIAGYGELYLPFMDKIKAAELEEGELAVGDHMLWMLFRSGGKVKVTKDLEWAGKGPLPIFLIKVKKDFKVFTFFMPRACGNISLLKIEDAPPPLAVCAISVDPVKANINDVISVDMSETQNAKNMEVEVFGPDGAKVASQSLTPNSPRWQTKFAVPGEYVFRAKAFNLEGKASTNSCEAKTYINFPPICKLWTSCVYCKDMVGRPITFDAANSTDPDGEVVKTDFEIKDVTGNVVDTLSDNNKPFSWEYVFTEPGTYTVTAIVTDDFGAVSEPVSIELEVTQKRTFFLVEGGPVYARGSHGPFFGARLGMLYKIVPGTLDFVLSGGGSLALKSAPWKSFFMANMVLNAHAGPAFFGGGVGFTTKVRENRGSDAELIGNIGFDLFDQFTLAGQMFFETRAPIGEGRSFSKHHKLMLGFRLLF